MILLKRFVLGVFWRRTAWMLIGGIALFSVFDLMKASEFLWDAEGSPVVNMIVYAFLRAPSLAAMLLPLCVLAGALSAFSTLARRNEFTIMRACGLRLDDMKGWTLVAIAPMAILHAAMLFAIAPKADYSLSAWLAEKGVSDTDSMIATSRLTIASEAYFVEAETASDDGTDVWSPTIVSFDADGAVQSVTTGSRARILHAGAVSDWQVDNAVRTDFTADRAPTVERKNVIVIKDMPPRAIVRNAQRPVEQLTLSALLRQAADEAQSEISRADLFAYAVRRLTGMGQNLVMLLLAAPMAFATARAGDAVRRALIAIAIAFAFIVADRTVFSLGLAGYLPPLISGAGAMALGIPLALYALFRVEQTV